MATAHVQQFSRSSRDLEKSFLHDVLSRVPISEQARGEPEDRVVVAVDEGVQTPIIRLIGERPEQVLVGHGFSRGHQIQPEVVRKGGVLGNSGPAAIPGPASLPSTIDRLGQGRRGPAMSRPESALSGAISLMKEVRLTEDRPILPISNEHPLFRLPPWSPSACGIDSGCLVRSERNRLDPQQEHFFNGLLSRV